MSSSAARPSLGARLRARSPLVALLVLSAVMVCVAAVPSANGAGGSGATARVAGLPTQGVYDQCAPATQMDACVERLQRLAGAGFGVVVNYNAWNTEPAQLGAYADAAAAAGVQVIWPLNGKAWRDGSDLAKAYPRLARTCGCDDLLAWTIGFLRDHPATYGWYVADEVPRAEQPLVQALADRVRALDPVHPRVLVQNGMAGIAGGDIAPFTSSADIIGADMYPVGSGADVSYVGSTMAAAQRQADAADRRMVAVLQSFSWEAYPAVSPVRTPRWPTAEEMREARDETLLRSDPSLILWYSLHDIERSADPAGHWADLVAAASAPAPASAPAAAAAAVRVAKTNQKRSSSAIPR